MSFLAPLYALGALAIAAPILFHLIRRTPRGELPFSSLMFLTPSPPRLTRRSRLDNVVLLLLRAAALGLLAMAFMRPFLRETAGLDLEEGEQRRVLMLIDASASMRRADLWSRAQDEARAALAAARPGDRIAIVAFDNLTHPILTFEETRALDATRRGAIAAAQINALKPSWNGTNLGQALIDAVGIFDDEADDTETSGRMPRKIILISDLAQGSKLEPLAGFDWPPDVGVEIKAVSNQGGNAGLRWLNGPDSDADDASETRDMRVQVFNDPDSRQESFQLAWTDAQGKQLGRPIDAYVPPGQARVFRVARPEASGATQLAALRLSGDKHPFDNDLFLADEPQPEATVHFLGADLAGDPNGLLYFLERVYQNLPGRKVSLTATAPGTSPSWDAAKPPPLVFLAGETTAAIAAYLHEYVNQGGTLVYLPGAAATGAALRALTDRTTGFEVKEAALKGDALLGELTFDHPLFSPFAPAQFNDFTKIHFWKYRTIKPEIPGARALAKFETGDPAIIERLEGSGRLLVFASGWSPADSQLARSSKFLPMMIALLDARDPRPFGLEDHAVGAPVRLPEATISTNPKDKNPSRSVTKPDGGRVLLGPRATEFEDADEPGVYRLDLGVAGKIRPFAVNLDPAESRTAPMPAETLEQYGCKLGGEARDEAERTHQRQMRNLELEGRQKLWRYLVIAAIGVLIAETWLAGRLSRTRSTREELVTT